MKIQFSKKELEIIKRAGIRFDATGDLDSEAMLEMDDLVSEYLMYDGIDDDNTVNADGKICEQILEKLVEEYD